MSFPVYSGCRAFVCFKCGSPLEDIKPSGFAPTYGEYRGECKNEHCGLRTYFEPGRLNCEDMTWPEWYSAAMPSWLLCCNSNSQCARLDRKYAPALLVAEWVRGVDPSEWRRRWPGYPQSEETLRLFGIDFEHRGDGQWYLKTT